MLLRLDAFGNVQWMKVLAPYATYARSVHSLTVLADGNVMGVVDVSTKDFKRQFIFSTTTAGEVKWCIQVNQPGIQTASTFLKQLRNGTILVGGWAYEATPDFYQINKQGFYVTALQPASGSVVWSRAYLVSKTVSTSFLTTSVKAITELSDGQISFFSSFSDVAPHPLPPYTKYAVQLITDQNGVLQRSTGFINGSPGCAVADVQPLPNDAHLLLLNDLNEPLLVQVNKDGGIEWQRGYRRVNSNMKASKLFRRGSQLQMYFSGKREVAMSALLQTEPDGSLPCLENNATVSSFDAKPFFTVEATGITTEPADKGLFAPAFFAFPRTVYRLQSTTTCTPTCCTEVVSDTSFIALCNQPFVQLPGGIRATESGLYYTRLKTSSGCDSLAYYNVLLEKTPVVSLGINQCLEGSDSLLLKATPGYATYTWMGQSRTDSSYTVKKPGTYWVTVTNRCGAATDSVTVFDRCDFPSYMPTAFTPNGDGRNDVFKFPAQNNNRFVSLQIYSRWGQLIYTTRHAAAGWDGHFKNTEQPAGSYVYHLTTTDLLGREKKEKGKVLLIR